MAFDKEEISGLINKHTQVGHAGDEGTFGRYAVAKPWVSRLRSRRQKVDLDERITFLYFVQSKALGLIKIGYAHDLNQRITDLRVGSADELYFIGSILFPDKERAVNAEAEFHGRFSHLHSHGEWFRPEPELLDLIKATAKPEQAEEFIKRKPRKKTFKSEYWSCGHKVEGYQSACTRCLLDGGKYRNNNRYSF